MEQRRIEFPQIALMLEALLVPLAMLAGALFGHPPLRGHYLSDWPVHLEAAGIGAVASFPLFIALVLLDRIPWKPLGDLERLVVDRVLPLFRQASWLELALLALLAGVGEEMLFRGWLQGWLEDRLPTLGIAVNIVLAAVVFGACHWLNTTYFVVATLAGVYFGLLLVWTGSLAAPVAAHAGYDFLALVFLFWKYPPNKKERLDEDRQAAPYLPDQR